MLRDYQQKALDAAIEYIKKCTDSGVIEAPTGAGKSHIIAELAKWLNKTVGKKVLCLAPSKELVQQNHAKYLTTGNPASIYSASINKSLAHDVVFGSPLSVKNDIEKFSSDFSLIIIDEAHRITNGVKEIIAFLLNINPKLRVIGLTATPYRLGTGYIYSLDEKGVVVNETQTKDPYFKKLVCKIFARELIDRGYLTPPHSEPTAIHYDTSLIVNHTEKEYAEAFEGHGRLTASIVADVVSKSVNRKGVMFFAATIQHANEIMQSLNPTMSRIVTGKTPQKEREKILSDFLAMRFKYLVNVAVLTTGFDAPHVDVVALLRATQSVSLLQQMVGRGLRLSEGKDDCLILDYADNINQHCPNGDIFDPDIKVSKHSGPGEDLKVKCPSCTNINEFVARENKEGYLCSPDGYFVDLAGKAIMTDGEHPMPIPSHMGRRCQNHTLTAGTYERCEYRWSFKICPECECENDITARYCESCKTELVDPNTRLVLEYTKIQKDPYSQTTNKVLSWIVKEHYTQNGDQTLMVTYTTEYRTFKAWYRTDKGFLYPLWENLCLAVFGKPIDSIDGFLYEIDNMRGIMPQTVTSHKDRKSKFFKVTAHNRPVDESP